MSAGHDHGPSGHGGNKGVALLISVLALVLAFSETLGKGAQTAALAYNIEASNLWAFFQAKTIRQTVLRTAAEQMEISNPGEAVKKQIAKWKETADRYQSEPETGEGSDWYLSAVSFHLAICFLTASPGLLTSICSAAVRRVVCRMVFAWKKAHRLEASML